LAFGSALPSRVVEAAKLAGARGRSALCRRVAALHGQSRVEASR
jgi:hypothetical protein